MEQPLATMPDLARWLREAAWPTWLVHGVDRVRGGLFEALDLDTRICAAEFRRLRVAARQIYVFSKAHEAGLAGAEDAVRIGLAFLNTHAAHEEGGYAWRFDLQHHAIDHTRDLYDHAFVLLAFASAARVLPEGECRSLALDLLSWIDASFAHEHEGYGESLPPALPRRQNPHMHFLEALLAAYESFGDAIFLERAATLVTLFRERLLDKPTGALPEFFDERLNPLRERGHFVVEPGHHYEWIWLLGWYQRLAGNEPELADISASLRTFADEHGIDGRTGHVVNAVLSDGSPVDPAFRLWPQAERLRAAALCSAPNRPEERAASAASLGAFLRPDGLWHERRSRFGTWSHEPAPASSLYHLTGAILFAAD